VASGDRGVVDVSKTVARGRSREVSDSVDDDGLTEPQSQRQVGVDGSA